MGVFHAGAAVIGIARRVVSVVVAVVVRDCHEDMQQTCCI